jgi:signal transduction histidine kinase/ligand-binding sensor domain-containing protein
VRFELTSSAPGAPSETTAKAVTSSILRSLSFAILAVLFLANTVDAVDPNRHISQYAHTAWRVQDGFEVGTTVAQTSDGYLWFGTSSGLLRFDGVKFVPYDLPVVSPSIRSYNYLLGGRDGSLWIGTRDGLARLKDGKLQWISDPAEHSGISVILEDPEGTIWLTRYHVPAHQGPLCRVEGSRLHCYGEADGILVSYGLGLARDSAGNLWFGSSALCRWRAGSGSTYLNEISKRPNGGDGIIDVAVGPSGTIWATTQVASPGMGVLWFSGSKWANYVVPGFDGRTLSSQALFMDREHSLWIGTDREGVYRVHDGVGEHYGVADGLTGREVILVFEDREGNIWVITNGGIDMFRDTPIVSYSDREGLSGTSIRAVLGLRDGSLWIANERAIDILNDGHHGVLPAQGTFDEDVSALFQDHNGVVWMGRANRLFSYRNDRYQEISAPEGSNVKNDSIAAITEDAAGNIWVLTARQRLSRVTNGRAAEILNANITNRLGGALAADHKGGLWIASRADTLRYYKDGNSRTISLKRPESSFSVFGLFVDSDDALLVATSDGLFRWDGQTIRVLNSRHGLPSDVVYSIILDDESALWVRCQKGVARISDSEFDYWRRHVDSKPLMQVFDRLDGSRPVGSFLIQPSATKTTDGRLWFVATTTVQMIDPKKTFRNELVPPVYVERVVADHKEYRGITGIKLPSLTRDVQIDYTALSLTVPQKVLFRYQLEGHHEGWQEAGTRRQAFYNDLAPGNYRFRVIASNNSGVWNETGASIEFSVAAPYYQAAWFRALCVAAILALLWAIYRVRVGVLEQRHQLFVQNQELLEQHHSEVTALNDRLMRAEEGERARIAGELHDGVLQKITLLSLSLGAAKRQVPTDSDAKEQIGEVQKKLIEVGSDIRQLSHQLHPAVLQESGLPAALRAYCEEFSKAHGIPVSCETDGSVKGLSPGDALCIYRLAQEALGNVAKHSAAKHAHVRVTRVDTRVCLSVSDDGVGFAAGRPGDCRGLGLISMRERVRQLNGTLEFDSEPGHGTTVKADIPFHPA